MADSRPRVRGRFAKNLDDDVPATSHGRKREDGDDDEVWTGILLNAKLNSSQHRSSIFYLFLEMSEIVGFHRLNQKVLGGESFFLVV